MRGLRKYLPPFAPDISGASSVLYEMGGILVICDAGGCTGNVCGFDEPRWFRTKSSIFSAGLRDMDAIFGKDDKLVEKLEEAASQMQAEFICVIGTPVPAVIGTDYQALKRMTEKKTGLPVMTIEVTGIRQYDAGEELSWLELFKTFAQEKMEVEPGRIGVIGATPLSVSTLHFKEDLSAALGEEHKVICYGLGDGLEKVREASRAEKNLVVSPSGLKAAWYLQQRFGTPFEIGYPPAAGYMAEAFEKNPECMQVIQRMQSLKQNTNPGFIQEAASDTSQKTDRLARPERILIVQQQVLAGEVRSILRDTYGVQAEIVVADFFDLKPELSQPGDRMLKEEADLLSLAREGGFALVIGDDLIRPMFDETVCFADLAHFACSGRLREEE